MHARLAAILLSLAACSRAPGGDAPAPARGAEVPVAFDWQRPVTALDLDPDEIASRLGSFEWTGAIEWTVSREGDDARRVRAVERHRIRQSASGEFEVSSDVDPGLWPGSDTGREVVYAGGATYARARHAPFRERPTDRGRDARRFRDETFHSARSIVRLLGPSLELRPGGDAHVLRRGVRTLAVALSKGAPEGARSPPAPASAPVPPDDDTRRRRAFLDGLRPLAASGELLLDAQSGAPLRVRLAATFALDGEPPARATVELLAQVTALGAEVAAVAPPKGALSDERKAAGVAAALEAAGLQKRGEEPEGKKERGEPADDAGEE